jgi:hypothetical protein
MTTPDDEPDPDPPPGCRIDAECCGRQLVGERHAGVWVLVWPRAFPKDEAVAFRGLEDASPAIEAFEAWAMANPALGWNPKRRGAA